MRHPFAIAALAVLGVCFAAPRLRAEVSEDDNRPARPAAKGSSEDRLAAEQEEVAKKFKHLEDVLIKLSEQTAGVDPRRAALLKQAVLESKDRDIANRFDKLVELLKQDLTGPALKNQAEVHQDLAKLLELLLSEDRGKRIESEKERIRQYIKQVNKLIKEQKGIKAETAGEADPKKTAEKQEGLADKTGKLAREMAEKEGTSKGGKAGTPEGQPNAKGEKADDKQGNGDKPEEKGEGKDPGKETPKQDEPKEKSQGAEGGGKPDGKQQGDGKGQGKPQGKQKSKGQGPGQPQGEQAEDEPQEDESAEAPTGDNAAQKRIAQAEKQMKEARRKLDEAKRGEATENQDKAIEKLEQAIAALEEILRQLREEESQRMLAMLETRFRKMLEMQVEVYDGTKRLDKVPEAQRDHDEEVEAGRLSRKEASIVTEADKALSVLHDEGSAVAFPEAVVGMRDDMEQVVVRLAQVKVEAITQGIEEDVISGLEEMIAALQKAQKDLEAKKSKPMPMAGEPIEPPLVDTLAEIKMIRALQMRVNRRTQHFTELTKVEQADKPELLKELQRLAEREERIHRATREIVAGRNK